MLNTKRATCNYGDITCGTEVIVLERITEIDGVKLEPAFSKVVALDDSTKLVSSDVEELRKAKIHYMFDFEMKEVE